jgi:hypothetical protein
MNNKEVLKYILEIYNITNTKFKKYIDNQNISINESKDEIIMYHDNEQSIFKCEYAGYYDNIEKNWYFSWILPNIVCSEESINYKLLNYGITLNINSNDSIEALYKQAFINPIINLKNNIELDNHIALIMSVLRNKVQFIYKHILFLDSTKKKYIINYYYIII